MISNKKTVQVLLSLLRTKGVSHIVVSPGSRNAPLSLSIGQDDFFSTYVIVDERSAGFFALGLSIQLTEPVALICTSGSAMLGYLPSFAEAYYQGVSLVAITADRPQPWIDQRDGQTIRQHNGLRQYTVYDTTLLEDSQDSTHIWYNERVINEALNATLHQHKPVHINIPFYEPLYEQVDGSTKTEARSIEHIFPYSSQLSSQIIEKYKDIWTQSKRKLILIGQLWQPHTLEPLLTGIVQKDDDVMIITEKTSNLPDAACIIGIDRLLFSMNEQECEAFAPDLLLTFGGMVVSKKIKALLRTHSPSHHWHAEVGSTVPDTYQCMTTHLDMPPKDFLQTLQEVMPTNRQQKGYGIRYRDRNEDNKKRHLEYITSISHCDLKAYHSIFASLPSKVDLHLGNSSVVRYAELFDFGIEGRVFCNRGTSGIEGCSSSAVGSAVHSPYTTLLISGDLSFLYDSNAYWHQYMRPDFRIIVMNNEGGGIFRIIPGPEKDEMLEKYFEAHHQTNIAPLCQTYGLLHASVDTTDGVEKALSTFFEKSTQPKLLEIKTPREENDLIFKQYIEYMKG